VEVDDLAVVDLRRPEVVSALELRLDELTGPRARAQALAGRARALGADGMVVPSAAHRGAWNLVVFPSGFGRLRAARSRSTSPRPPAIA